MIPATRINVVRVGDKDGEVEATLDFHHFYVVERRNQCRHRCRYHVPESQLSIVTGTTTVYLVILGEEDGVLQTTGNHLDANTVKEGDSRGHLCQVIRCLLECEA